MHPCNHSACAHTIANTHNLHKHNNIHMHSFTYMYTTCALGLSNEFKHKYISVARIIGHIVAQLARASN